MTKLHLTPNRASYAYKDVGTANHTALTGGLGRSRADTVGVRQFVQASWVLGLTQYAYLQDFIRANLRNGSGVFQIDLIIDDAPLDTYNAWFVPRTMRSQDLDGLRCVVTCTLEVGPPDNLYYTSLLYPYEADEALEPGLVVPVSGWLLAPFNEDIDVGLVVPLDGILRTPLVTVTINQDAIDVGLVTPQSGDLVVRLIQYSHPATAYPDQIDVGLVIPLSGDLIVRLVSYNHPATAYPDQIDVGLVTPQSGTLT